MKDNPPDWVRRPEIGGALVPQRSSGLQFWGEADTVLSEVGRESADFGNELREANRKTFIGGYAFNRPDYHQLRDWATEFNITVEDMVEWFDIMRRVMPLDSRDDVFQVIDGSIHAICFDPYILDKIFAPDGYAVTSKSGKFPKLLVSLAIDEISRHPRLYKLLVSLHNCKSKNTLYKPYHINIQSLPKLRKLSFSNFKSFGEGHVKVVNAPKLDLVRINGRYDTEVSGLGSILCDSVLTLEFWGTQEIFERLITKIQGTNKLPKKISVHFRVSRYNREGTDEFIIGSRKGYGSIESLRLRYSYLRYRPEEGKQLEAGDSSSAIKYLSVDNILIKEIDSDLTFLANRMVNLETIEIDLAAGHHVEFARLQSGINVENVHSPDLCLSGLTGYPQKFSLNLNRAPNLKRVQVTREPWAENICFFRSVSAEQQASTLFVRDVSKG